MYSVNPFGNSTLSCNAGSIALPPEYPWIARRYRNWLEKYEFKQYWNLFLAPPPPFARVDIKSSSGHCEAPSIFFFFLHSSMMSLYWIAPCQSLDGLFDHVVVWHVKTLLIVWSLCFNVYPFFFFRTGIETEVNVTVGFCLGLALAMGFSKAMSSSFLVSIRFCHVLINTIHDSPRMKCVQMCEKIRGVSVFCSHAPSVTVDGDQL